MKELNLNEVAQVSGGGHAGARQERQRESSTNYGGQTDGFQSNKAAAGYGLLDGVSQSCLNSMGWGTANTAVAARGGVASFGMAAASALADVGRTCSSSSSSRSGPPFH